MTERSCGACKWFAPLVEGVEDSPGLCGWPVERLPHALRWGAREAVTVYRHEGETCSCFEPRQFDVKRNGV